MLFFSLKNGGDIRVHLTEKLKKYKERRTLC